MFHFRALISWLHLQIYKYVIEYVLNHERDKAKTKYNVQLSMKKTSKEISIITFGFLHGEYKIQNTEVKINMELGRTT